MGPGGGLTQIKEHLTIFSSLKTKNLGLFRGDFESNRDAASRPSYILWLPFAPTSTDTADLAENPVELGSKGFVLWDDAHLPDRHVKGAAPRTILVSAQRGKHLLVAAGS